METGCDENCDTNVLLLVTERASLANLLRPANRSPGVGQGNGKNENKRKKKHTQHARQKQQ